MALTKRNQLVKELIVDERGIRRRNDAPFPQANSVEKLVKVIELAKKGVTTKKEFQEQMSEIHTRQVDYYINAAVYLGILREKNNKYILNKRFKENEKMALLEFMMQNHIIREVVTLYYITKNIPSEMEIARILSKYGSGLENSTLTRRIKTVESWAKWILNKK